MQSPERAISEGKNLLDRFRSAQPHADGDDSSSSYSQVESERPHDKAIAEGSLLAQSYSASKRGGRALSDATSDVQSDENGGLDFSEWGHGLDRGGGAVSNTPQTGNEAAEIIGRIMAELGSIENHNEPVETALLSERLGKISDMLCGVKNQLLQSSTKDKKVNKLDFSPYSNGEPSGPEDENSMVQTPGKNDILKNYMRNQLELQESEWEGYEEAINSLAEQLESKAIELEERDETIQRLTDERDDLVSMTTSLGERIQGLGQEKYQLLMEREEWIVEKQELSEHKAHLEGIIAGKDSELDRTNVRMSELEDELNGLQDKYRASERSIHDGRKKIESLTTENIELQKLLAANNSEKADMTEQLDQWEQFERSKMAEIDNLHLEMKGLETKFRAELQEATERSNILSQQVYESESAAASTIAELRSRAKEVSAQIESDQAHIQSLVVKINLLESGTQSGVKDLTDALDSAQRYRAELDDALAALQIKDESIRQLEQSLEEATSYANKLDARANQVEQRYRAELDDALAALQIKDESIRQLEQSLEEATSYANELDARANQAEREVEKLRASNLPRSPVVLPSPAAADNLSPPQRLPGTQMLPIMDSPDEPDSNVLKNYMKNQLELQESEWENYEETINNLASQLEIANEQVDTQEATILALQSERDGLLSQLAHKDINVNFNALNRQGLNVDVSVPHTSVPNQPNSMRSFISLDASSIGDPASPHHPYPSYTIDYSMFDNAEMGDQVEMFKTHVEQQIRVQVSQLQSLQESLSEEKNATSLLQKQKLTLKSMIGNLHAEIEELKGRIEDYEATESDLRAEASELRVLISEKEDKLANMVSSAAAASAPPTPACEDKSKPADYPRTPEVFEYRATIASLESNLSRKTSRCDELTAEIGRLRTALTSKTDELGQHKARFIKAEAELQAALLEKEKTITALKDMISRLEVQSKHDASSIDELNLMIMTERQENQALNDVLNMIKEKDDATEDMLKSMTEQRMVMSTRFVEIEERVSTLTLQLKESESRHSTTVKMLKEAESDRQAGDMRIVEYKSKLADLDQATFDRTADLETQVNRQLRLLEDNKEEIEHLKKRLASANDLAEGFSKTAFEEKARMVTAQLKIEELAETVQSLRNQNDRLKRDSDADRREIESLLLAADDRTLAGDESRKNLLAQLSAKDEIIAERDSSINVLQHQAQVRCDDIIQMEGQIRDLKRSVATGATDCTAIRAAFKAMANEVSYFGVSSGEQSNALISRVNGWVSLFSQRMDTVCDQLAFLTEDYRDREALTADLKEQLADSRGYSERLEQDRFELEQRLAEFEDAMRAENEKIEDLSNENSQLRAELDDAERRVYQERAMVDQSKQSFSGDIHRLAERLENAERRAAEAAATNAKLFANGARGTAYLEGECSRLRGLVDHLRLVNAKLQGDAKAANALAAHGRGFENRLKISTAECDRLRTRIVELEGELHNRDSSHLVSLHEVQEADAAKQRDHDEEIAQMSNEIATWKAEVNERKSELESALAAKESSEHEMQAEVDQLAQDLQRSDENAAYHEGRAAELDSRVSALRDELAAAEEASERFVQERNTQVFSLQEQINDRTQQVEEFQRQLMTSENSIKTLETDVEILRAKLKATSEELSSRDDTFSKLTNKYEAAVDELDLLKSKVRTSESELEAVHVSKDKDSELLSIMRSEKEALKSRLTEVENEVHRVTGALTASNNKIKSLLVEIRQKEEAIVDYEQDVMRNNKSLLEAESRIEDLVQDVSEFRERAQSLELDLAEQKSDMASLKNEIEVITKDYSQKAKENAYLNAQLQDTQENVSSLSNKLSQEQAQSKERMALLLELSSAERGIVVTMNSFISANNAAEEKKDNEQKKLGKKPTDLFEDMLASPPPPNMLIYATPTGHKPPLEEKPAGNRLAFDAEVVPYTVGGSHFYGLQASVNALQDFISHYRARCSGLEAALSAASSRSSDIEEEFKVLRGRFSERNSELSRLTAELSVAKEELEQLTMDESGARNECDALRSKCSSFSNQLRIVKRELQNLLHAEATSRAQAIVEAHGESMSPLLLHAGTSNKARSEETEIIPFADDGNSVLLSDIKNTVSGFSNCLEKLSHELSVREREIRALEGEARERNADWEREKTALHTRIVLAAESAEEEQLVNNECRSLLQKVTDELNKARAGEERNANLLKEQDAKLRFQLGDIEILRDTLQQAERARDEAMEELQKEKADCSDTMSLLDQSQRDIQNLRQKITSLNLVIEEKTYENDRLLSSNQSAVETRQALELELEQTRRDLEQRSSHEENMSQAAEAKASYEVERLLAALAATVDHMQSATQGASLDHSFDMSQHSYSSFAQGGPGQNLVVRVDHAVKKLSEMRAWAREEKKTTRKLTSTLSDLERDLAALKTSSSERIRILTEDLERARARDKSHQDHISVITEKESVVTRLQTELTVLQKELVVYRSTKGADQEARNNLSSQLMSKDTELSRLTRENQRCVAENETLHTKLLALEKAVSALTSEKSELSEDSKQSTSAISKLKETISRLEHSADRYKEEIEALQKRLLTAASNTTPSMETMRHELESLERALHSAKESHDSYRRETESRHAVAATEAEEQRRRIVQLENKLDAEMKARSSTSEEVMTLRHELHKVQTKREMESSHWSSSKAKLEAMRNSEDDWKLQLDAASSMLENMEDRLNQSESECNRLRAQLTSYQESHSSDYRAQLAIEIDARKRLEVEASRISSALERSQRENATITANASALRAEGRHVRRCVIEIAEHLHELVGEMKQGAHQDVLNKSTDSLRPAGSLLAAALGLSSKPVHPEGGEFVQTVGGEGVAAHSGRSGGAAENVHELTTALENIRKTISWMKSVSSWNTNHDMDGRIRRLEAENARLLREADNFASLQEDKCQRLQAEIDTLENLLSAARHRESARIHDLDSRKTEIEGEHARDKEALKIAENEARRALDRASELESENEKLQRDFNKLSATTRQADETDMLRRQLQTAKSEAEFLTQRNKSLHDTIANLEALSHRGNTSELSMTAEYPAGLPGISYLSTTLGSGEFLKSIDPQQSTQIHEGILQLQRHLGKYRLRAKMFEDISNIFRGAYLSSVSMSASRNGTSSSLVSSSPYGRVVEAVRKSYEESMSLLEEQIESCLGVIRQNNSYMTELRTRLEDTLRALYKNGRGEAYVNGSSIESSQLQHIEMLSQSLKQAQSKYEVCSTTLAEERRRDRQRHEALVSELSSVVTTCEQSQTETSRWKDESEILQRRLATSDTEITNLKRTVDSLRHGLIETDMELDTVQRLHRRGTDYSSFSAESDMRPRASSQGHARPSRLSSHTGMGERSIDSGYSRTLAFQSRAVQEDVHESSAFSVKDLSRDHVDVSSNRGDLSDAVQAALGAAAQLRVDQKRRFEESSRAAAAQDSWKSFQYNSHHDDIISSQRIRSRDESAGRHHITPPRDKRVAVSSTPTSLNMSSASLSRSYGQQHQGASNSPGGALSQSAVRPAAAQLASHTQQASSRTSMTGISTYTSMAADSSSPIINQSFRRKVKATVRKNT